MHPDQLSITEETVRTLVTEQFPHWRRLPVRRIESSGTVNAIFRIGASLAARFPLQAGDPGSVEREALAAREILGRTRFPTPEPVALGAPGHGYPLPWSVQTWLPGTPATDVDPGGSVPFALDLAEFVRGVRAIDTRGRTFPGRGRGGVLSSHDAWMETSIEKSNMLFDARELRFLWARFRTLPPARHVVMNHGDLIPGNVLVSGGRLAGVLDVGGLKAADPALDLVAGWQLLEAGPRGAFRAALEGDYSLLSSPPSFPPTSSSLSSPPASPPPFPPPPFSSPPFSSPPFSSPPFSSPPFSSPPFSSPPALPAPSSPQPDSAPLHRHTSPQRDSPSPQRGTSSPPPPHDDAEWERGKAWAFEQAMGAVWYYIDSNPAMHHMARRTLERILADA